MRQSKVLIMAVLVCGILSNAFATVTEYDFEADFATYDLLVDIVEDTFTGSTQGITVKSAVYRDGDSYLYMYQVVNGSLSSLTRFTAAPFADLTENALMGYFNSSQPADFLPDGVSPSWAGTGDLSTNPTVALSFNVQTGGAPVPSGSHSAVFFVESELSPDSIDGHVMAGGVAFGQVLGPAGESVPEPASITLLALGAITLSRRRKLL